MKRKLSVVELSKLLGEFAEELRKSGGDDGGVMSMLADRLELKLGKGFRKLMYIKEN